MRRALRALLVAAAAAALIGCGGSGGGRATVWVTRDQGATALAKGTVPAGLTALQGLDAVASVESGYDGAFVQAIDGLAGSKLHQRDWFYFVNGYEADRGAAEYRLRAGDVEWWDYRSWEKVERAPIVVGAFPEPFLHGYDGRRRAAAVRYAPGLREPAQALARLVGAHSLAPLGAGTGREENLLLVVRGRPGLIGGFRDPRRSRAGDPVRFVVSGARFTRALALDPELARYRYQAAP
jgi:hypothetical protein